MKRRTPEQDLQITVARHSNGALYVIPEIECNPGIHAVQMPADCGELPGAS